MPVHDSSAPSFEDVPSSEGLLVRHVSKNDHGPGIAKTGFLRVMDVQHTPGQLIRGMREHVGISQDRLAARMGMHVDTLRRFELDRVTKVDRLAVVLELFKLGARS